jgi:hemin uptake protein HemP
MSLFNQLFNKKIEPKDSSPKVLAVEIMGHSRELVIFHHGKRYLLAENNNGQLKLYN